MRSMEKANRNTEGLKPPSWYESLSLLFLSLSSLLYISLLFLLFFLFFSSPSSSKRYACGRCGGGDGKGSPPPLAGGGLIFVQFARQRSGDMSLTIGR